VQLYFISLLENVTKFLCQFPGEPVPSRQSIQSFVSILKTTGSLLDKKPDREQTVLTEENWTVLVLDFKLHKEIPLSD
jgi:hypothetical protein